MKTTKTFADKANDIIKKYPYAKNSKTDNESMLDELEALAEEQESMKGTMESANQTKTQNIEGMEEEAMFPTGGYTKDQRNFLTALNPLNSIGNLMEDIGGITSNLPSHVRVNTASILDNPVTVATTSTPDTTVKEVPKDRTKVGSILSKIGDDFKENSENYYSALAGISPALTNYINMKSVGNANRVQPAHYNPTVTPTWFSSTPIENKLQQNLASASYNMSKRGGDFDSYVAGLSAVNYGTNTALGEAMTEGQKLNMAEQARIDKALSEQNLINTAAENQASVDYHQEQLDKDQLKREYRAGVGENIGGIFKDIADYQMSKKIGTWAEMLAKLQNTK